MNAKIFKNNKTDHQDLLIIPSNLVPPVFAGGGYLTPAQLAVLWEIANWLRGNRRSITKLMSQAKFPDGSQNSILVKIPAKQLRGPFSREDNYWLRECISRLQQIKISGETNTKLWDSVLIAESEIDKFSHIVEILIPPKAIAYWMANAPFTTIERDIAHDLTGPARRLYASLCDKGNRDKNDNTWTYSVDHLKEIFGCPEKYENDWGNFRRRHLLNALAGLKDILDIEGEYKKSGRRITAVKLTWRWRSVKEIEPAVPNAPPLKEDTRSEREENVSKWWYALPSGKRDSIIKEQRAEPWEHHVFKTEKPESWIAHDAYEKHHKGSGSWYNLNDDGNSGNWPQLLPEILDREGNLIDGKED